MITHHIESTCGKNSLFENDGFRGLRTTKVWPGEGRHDGNRWNLGAHTLILKEEKSLLDFET